MKILYLITGLGEGGAERQVVNLADALRDRGHEVIIAFMTGEARIKPKSSDILLFCLGAKKTVDGLFGAGLRLRRLIVSFKPDVVHSHMVHANIFARFMRPFLPIPRLICTAHNTNEGGGLRMPAYRLTHRMADVSTNVSREAVAAFEKKGAVPKGGMLVMRNGIDTLRFCADTTKRQANRLQQKVGENETLVIAVGRLTEAKDFSNLLRAWELLVRTRSHIKLWIVGDGELRGLLENQAVQLGVAKTISFLGIRDDVPELLNAADLFVLSSAWEGFALVVAEAMACGKVVVATDSGGVKETLGECGFLVKPQNSQELAQALDHALSLPGDEFARLGEQARLRVINQFSLAGVAEEWLAIYAAKGN